MSEIPQSVDVIRPFLAEVEGPSDIQIMGGIASTALRHPDLVVDFVHKELRVPEVDIPIFRPNGTLRDADVFVLTENTERIQEVKKTLVQSIDDQLIASVCAIHPFRAYERQIGNQTEITSDRYRVNPFKKDYAKVLPPFVATIDPEALETWQLIVNDELTIPVSHPGATFSNYTQRSIEGLRPKDAKKMNAAARNVFAKAPEIKEWLLDGPGWSQFELSYAFTSLRQQRRPTVNIIDGIELPTMTLDAMTDSHLMIDPETSRAFRRQAVGFAALKSRASFAISSNEKIVAFFNEPKVEELFARFIKSR